MGCLFGVFALVGGVTFSGSPVTIVGTINGIAQLESGDDVYDLDEDEISDEVAAMVNQTVKVCGTVYREDGRKILSVRSYEAEE